MTKLTTMSKMPSSSVGIQIKYLWQSPGYGKTSLASEQSLSACLLVVVGTIGVVGVGVVGLISHIGAVPTHCGFSGSYTSPLANSSLTLCTNKYVNC